MFCLQRLTCSCINEFDSVPEGQFSLPAKKPPEARGGWPFLMNGLLWERYRPGLSKRICNSEVNLVSNSDELQHTENTTEVFFSNISKPKSLNFLILDCLESLKGSLWAFGTSPTREQSSSSLNSAADRLCKDPTHQALRCAGTYCFLALLWFQVCAPGDPINERWVWPDTPSS